MENKNVASKTVDETKTVNPNTDAEDGPLFMLDETLLTAKTNGGGKKIRPNVGYTIDGRMAAKAAEMPNQARVLVVLISQQLKKSKPVISEPELLKVLEAAKLAGTLDTTQDAWRIFQYYRPRLEDAKILIKKPVASAVAA